MWKGQAGLEMVALMGGILIALLAVIIILPEKTSAAGNQIDRQTAQDTADIIADAADEVYLSGDGAQKSVWADFPEGYDAGKSFVGGKTPGGSWSSNRTVSIYVAGVGDAFSESRAPLCGRLPNASGKYPLTLYYNNSGHVMVNATC